MLDKSTKKKEDILCIIAIRNSLSLSLSLSLSFSFKFISFSLVFFTYSTCSDFDHSLKCFYTIHICCIYILCQEMTYIQTESLLSDSEYINIVYICLHANYLNKILFKPINWASTRENLSSGICKQHKCRPAVASTQSN